MNSFFWAVLLLFLDASNINGLSINIIHGDSISSPIHNHSTPLFQLSRVYHFNYSSMGIQQKDIESRTSSRGTFYFMEISTGNPMSAFHVMMDTKIDLFWLSRAVFPVSHTFYIRYGSEFCDQVEGKSRGQPYRQCKYSYIYKDGSSMTGTLSSVPFHIRFSTHLLVFGSTDQYIIGGLEESSQGMVGLGRGKLSLVRQLGNGKFSYCLPPKGIRGNGLLKFGDEAMMIFGDNAVSTTFKFKRNYKSYFLVLEGVSVRDIRTDTSASPINIVIDLMSAITYLHISLYAGLATNIKNAMTRLGVEPTNDSTGTYNLCYPTTFKVKAALMLVQVTLHFANNANVPFHRTNIFQEYGGLHCMLIYATNGRSILGNLAQVNFKVGINHGTKKITFAPAQCIEEP